MLKCQRANELLIREYSPERSPALINFVHASHKERRRTVDHFVSMETCSIHSETDIFYLFKSKANDLINKHKDFTMSLTGEFWYRTKDRELNHHESLMPD